MCVTFPVSFQQNMASSESLTDSKLWKHLETQKRELENTHMRTLFTDDPNRFLKFSTRFHDILLDYSKNIVTEKTMENLFQLFDERRVREMAEKMFRGDKINTTEDRAVLHIALRNRSNSPIIVDGKDVMPEVNNVLHKMRKWTEEVRSGAWKGTFSSFTTFPQYFRIHWEKNHRCCQYW